MPPGLNVVTVESSHPHAAGHHGSLPSCRLSVSLRHSVGKCMRAIFLLTVKEERADTSVHSHPADGNAPEHWASGLPTWSWATGKASFGSIAASEASTVTLQNQWPRQPSLPLPSGIQEKHSTSPRQSGAA